MHKWFITNSDNTDKYKFIEVKCIICGIYAFSDPLAGHLDTIYLYSIKNGYTKENNPYYADLITCEEYIIKKIIE